MQLDLVPLEKSPNTKVREFARSYKFWRSFFEGILENSAGNPNIYSLVTNIRLVILTGYAEQIGNGRLDKERFDDTLNALNEEEKFFLCVVSQLKPINKKANALAKEYETNPNDEIENEFK